MSDVTVTATGGTAPFTGTGVFTRPAGTHSFVVTDANNCSDTVAVTITEPPDALAASASATPILCYGGTSTVTVTATGGTPPYTGTGSFDRGAGTYSFTVTDANGCTTTTSSVSITEPPELIVAASATQIACGVGNSTVTVTATGGTPPYTGTGVFSRAPGTHTFSVTDDNGCTASTSVTIVASPGVIAAASATPILCNGGMSDVTVTATGGTAPFTGTGVFTRPAGTHSFVVTDANNCSDTVVVTITEPPALLPTAVATSILCNGGTTTITVDATGGTPPYSGTGSFVRSAGTYSFTVTDANNCSAQVSIVVSEPQELQVAVAATPILCYGDDSDITISASGGTQPYTGTGVFTRGPGTYTFSVTDANGCTATTTVTVEEALELIATASATDILCKGGTSTVTVAAYGGTPPYTGTGMYIRGAGIFTFTVTDANNCSAMTSITITEPPELNVSLNANTILCTGDTTMVTVTATGGTPPYTGTGSFLRTAGNYIFTVTDDNGCTASASIFITQPPELIADVDATPIMCHGDTSSVHVTATGGTLPYYGTGVFGKVAGTYTFIVTDANGCADTVTITLTEPPPMLASSIATPILCNGDMSTVTVTANGGTPPYSGVGTFSRPAGTHTFTVTDANLCDVTTTVTITEPPPIVPLADATPILCFGGSTTITVSATGGTPPYNGTGSYVRTAGAHTFTVTDANNCTAQVIITVPEPPRLDAGSFATAIRCFGDSSNVTVSAYGGTQPYTGTGLFTRGPGTHVFTITDANGCTETTSVTITEPPQLQAASSAPPILCFGGTTDVTVTASGGTPPYSGTGVFSRAAGSHNFTVVDSNGCTATTTIIITEPPELIVSLNAIPILCTGDTTTVTVTATGGTPPYIGTGSFVLPAGNYVFTVTDDNGCTASASILITEPPPLIADANATPIMCYGDTTRVYVTATGGTPPYNGTGVFGKVAGTYIFIVTDANGCVDTAAITLTEPPPLLASSSATPILCHGDMSTVTITASGGTPPYAGIGTFSRPAGTHTFTVTDANLCDVSTTITITEPPPIIPTADATPILCFGGGTTITVSATGGTPPYSGTGSFVRTAGAHTFTVTDANNCTAQVIITVPEPPRLDAGSFATAILCFGDSSNVIVSAYGGTQPYSGTGLFTRGPGTYVFTVTDANGCTATTSVTISEPPLLQAASTAPPILCYGGTTDVTVTASGGTPPYSGTGIFSRSAGSHSFTVLDSNGCAATTTIIIAEPPPVVVSTSSTPLLCGQDLSTVTVSASGGTPPYTGTGTFSLPVGVHIFVVTDANGCTAADTIDIVGPPLLVGDASATPIKCHGGNTFITVSASGGTPPYRGTGLFIRQAGTYTFIVRDANDCADTVQITVTQPPPLTVTCIADPHCVDGFRGVHAVASGGTPPYTYFWSPGNATTPHIQVPCNNTGTYTVLVRDANWDPNDPNNGACEASCSISLQFFEREDPTDDGLASDPGSATDTGDRDGQTDSNRFDASSSASSMTHKDAGAHPTDEYALFENYPNPFNPTTTIKYYVPEESHVRLSIISTLGKTITTLVNERVDAGMHHVTWDATSTYGEFVNSGSYFYRIHATSLLTDREYVRARLMLLLR